MKLDTLYVKESYVLDANYKKDHAFRTFIVNGLKEKCFNIKKHENKKIQVLKVYDVKLNFRGLEVDLDAKVKIKYV